MHRTPKPTRWCPFAKNPGLTFRPLLSLLFKTAVLTGPWLSICGCKNSDSYANIESERMKTDSVSSKTT